MKIVSASITHAPDDDRVFYREALSLRKYYKDVTVIGVGENPADVMVKGVRQIQVADKGIRQNIQQVHDVLEGISPDILHVHEPHLLKLAAGYRAFSCKVIYDAHEDYAEIIRLFSRRNLLRKHTVAQLIRFWERLYVPKMDAVITVTPNLADHYKKLTNKPVTEVRNYPRPAEAFTDLPQLEHIYQFAAGRRIIGYVGQIARERHPEWLFDTVHRLNQQGYHLAAVFVGPVSERDREWFNGLIRQHDHEVLALPPVPHDQVYTLMKQHFSLGWAVLPYHKQFVESFPNKIFEYMQAGVPFIASDLSYVRRFLTVTTAGLILKDLSMESLTRQIGQLLNDRQLLQRMAGDALSAYHDGYRWESEEIKLAELYKHLSKGCF